MPSGIIHEFGYGHVGTIIETQQNLLQDFYHEFKTNHYTHVYDAFAYFMPHSEQGEAVPTFLRSQPEGHYNPKGERILSAGFYQTLMSIESEKRLLGTSD